MKTRIPTEARRHGSPQMWFVVFVLLLVVVGSAQAQIFTDWKSIDTNQQTVSGTLGSTSVTFSWTTGGDVPVTWLNGNYTGFAIGAFTPTMATSDALEFVGNTSNATYTVTFGTPVSNPILQLASEGSLLTFDGATPIFVSGDDNLRVSGNQVIGMNLFGVGHYPPNNDANGTVQFLGTYSSSVASHSD